MKDTVHQRGQTMVMLLVFTVIAVTILSAAVAILITNSRTTDKFTQGTVAYTIAESGAENAVLRLLRDPSYTGETVAIQDGSAAITVSGSTTKTITVTGTMGNYQRTVQLTASYINNTLTVTAWKEI